MGSDPDGGQIEVITTQRIKNNHEGVNTVDLIRAKEKILFLASRLILKVYNIILVSLVILVMVWHRAWSLKLRRNG